MKKILLLGAGYANMGLLKSLNEEVLSMAEWKLVNKDSYHCKTIALHDVASGKHNRSVLFPLKFALPEGVHFVEDSINYIDDKAAYGKERHEYDYLVVGLGFSSDNFGIKGVNEYTQNITSYESANGIAKKILERLESYKIFNDENDLAFIVCGGGFTGIEFVGSLAQEVRKNCAQMGIDFGLVKIYCIEAMPRILPMFSEGLLQVALKRLEELGVSVLTNSKILECKEGIVIIEKEGEKQEILANTIIWTAGVRGNEVISNSPFFKSGRSKVEVNNYLQPINQENKMDNIFVIGDCAALKDPSNGRFYPPTAQIARKQGEYLARILENLLRVEKSGGSFNIDTQTTFSFEPQGSICSIGSGYAVGIIGKKEVQGMVANAAKWFVESGWSYKLEGLPGVFKAD